MPSTTHTALADAAAALRQAEVARVVALVEWAADHEVSDPGLAAETSEFLDRATPMGGPGCPLVSEFAVLGLGPLLGMSGDGARMQLSRALELAHRLPRLYARVLAGEVPVWRAGRIADSTAGLPAEGADHVDQHLSWCAHHCTWAQLERLVETALTIWAPHEAEDRRLTAAEHREVRIKLTDPGHEITGTVYVDAVLDYADAVDLEAAVAARARQLGILGSTESLDVRRSVALGDLARAQLAIDFDDTTAPDQPAAAAGRSLVITAHVDATGVARLDDPTGRLVLVEQIAGWCAEATKVTIRPVLDLRATLAAPTYAIPDRIRETVQLTHSTCVFPHCGRRAAACDLDHITPWPGGQTSTDNLAPLCRRHHRLKTHGGWTYEPLAPDTGQPPGFAWTSPQHTTYSTA